MQQAGKHKQRLRAKIDGIEGMTAGARIQPHRVAAPGVRARIHEQRPLLIAARCVHGPWPAVVSVGTAARTRIRATSRQARALPAARIQLRQAAGSIPATQIARTRRLSADALMAPHAHTIDATHARSQAHPPACAPQPRPGPQAHAGQALRCGVARTCSARSTARYARRHRRPCRISTCDAQSRHLVRSPRHRRPQARPQ